MVHLKNIFITIGMVTNFFLVGLASCSNKGDDKKSQKPETEISASTCTSSSEAITVLKTPVSCPSFIRELKRMKSIPKDNRLKDCRFWTRTHTLLLILK